MTDCEIDEQVATLRRMSGLLRLGQKLDDQIVADKAWYVAEFIEAQRRRAVGPWTVSGPDRDAMRAVEGAAWDAMGAGLS